ncbi:MAG: Rrf2 family transcriptional regulator, partial [Longimicrobiales bacterium]|nr:Rrf2 family transcriptional regulator [Longimicrobiales bacterium]
MGWGLLVPFAILFIDDARDDPLDDPRAGTRRLPGPVLSRTAGYALHATVAIARMQNGGPVRAADVADRLEIPGNYLSKILQNLA